MLSMPPKGGRAVATTIVGLAIATAGCTAGQAGGPSSPEVGSSGAADSSSPQPKTATPPPPTPSGLPPAPPTAIPTATGPQTPNSPVLVAEAEAVARLYFYEDVKIAVIGGSTSLPPSFATLIDGEERELVTQGAALIRKNGTRRIGTGKAHIASSEPSRPADMASYGAIVVLRQCWNSGNDYVTDNFGTRRPAPHLTNEIYFKRHKDGSLRVISNSQTEVRSC